MRRFTFLFILLIVGFASTAQAQTSAPRPAPELKKLAIYVGQWRYEVEYKPGPLGPADKVTGDATGEMILGGFFLQWRWKERGTVAESQGFEMLSYDALNKNYASSIYGDDGSISLGAYVFDGNKVTNSGKFRSVVGGKQYLYRVIEVFAADSMSFMQQGELSSDGKSWTPWLEGTFTKVTSTPKK